jgi:hypothetical protein
VAAAQQRDQGEPDLMMLADDHALDVGKDLLSGQLQVGHRAPRRDHRTGGSALGLVDSTSGAATGFAMDY